MKGIKHGISIRIEIQFIFSFHSADGPFRGGRRWRRRLRRFNRSLFGKNALDLFAFVVYPNQWNYNADDAQPLRCCENVFVGLSRWRISLGRISLLIRNDALCLDKHLFLRLTCHFRFLSGSFTRSDTFWMFLFCGGRFLSHLFNNRLLCHLLLSISHNIYWIKNLIEKFMSNVQ